jgi:hypothetical protein
MLCYRMIHSTEHNFVSVVRVSLLPQAPLSFALICYDKNVTYGPSLGRVFAQYPTSDTVKRPPYPHSP